MLEHYDPELLRAMGRAYDVSTSFLDLRAPPVPHQMVARFIVRLADRGERDQDMLCATTLEWFTHGNPQCLIATAPRAPGLSRSPGPSLGPHITISVPSKA